MITEEDANEVGADSDGHEVKEPRLRPAIVGLPLRDAAKSALADLRFQTHFFD